MTCVVDLVPQRGDTKNRNVGDRVAVSIYAHIYTYAILRIYVNMCTEKPLYNELPRDRLYSGPFMEVYGLRS